MPHRVAYGVLLTAACKITSVAPATCELPHQTMSMLPGQQEVLLMQGPAIWVALAMHVNNARTSFIQRPALLISTTKPVMYACSSMV